MYIKLVHRIMYINYWNQQTNILMTNVAKSELKSTISELLLALRWAI